MTYDELVASVASIGLDPRSTVAWVGEGGVETASENVAYNIVRTQSGLAVLMRVGRGQLTEGPWPGYRFTSADDAIKYVWRSARSDVSHDLLSADERVADRLEAEEIILREAAAYEAAGGEAGYKRPKRKH